MWSEAIGQSVSRVYDAVYVEMYVHQTDMSGAHMDLADTIWIIIGIGSNTAESWLQIY